MEKRLDLRVLPLRAVVVGQIARRPRRVFIIGTQYAALDLKGLAVERLGLRVLFRPQVLFSLWLDAALPIRLTVLKSRRTARLLDIALGFGVCWAKNWLSQRDEASPRHALWRTPQTDAKALQTPGPRPSAAP